jgi:hypothetical protein
LGHASLVGGDCWAPGRGLEDELEDLEGVWVLGSRGCDTEGISCWQGDLVDCVSIY